MSAVAAAVVVSSIGGAVIGSKSAKKAAKAQTQSAELEVAELRAAREELRKLLQPYVDAGSPALQGQMDLVGLGEEGAQEAAIAEQENSPFFRALLEQGEDAILQNASATGGLRGGNVQGALAQFRPSLLNDFIEQQYGRLGGLVQLGQNSAAGVGAAGINVAGSIGDAFGRAGDARANAALASGAGWQNALGTIGGFAASKGGQTALGKIF